MENLFWDFLWGGLNTLYNITSFLMSPIKGELFGIEFDLGNWTPLGLLSVGGIAFICGLHVWHLVKPVG